MKIGSSLPRPQQRDTGPYQVLCNSHSNYLFFSCHGSHIWPGRPLWLSSITLRHTTTCKTRLDEWSDRRRDLYPTTHNARKRQTTMTPAGFKRAIPASERPQTQATLKLHCLKIQSVLPIPPITNIYIPRDLFSNLILCEVYFSPMICSIWPTKIIIHNSTILFKDNIAPT